MARKLIQDLLAAEVAAVDEMRSAAILQEANGARGGGSVAVAVG
jgi:hypothetical protein